MSESRWRSYAMAGAAFIAVVLLFEVVAALLHHQSNPPAPVVTEDTAAREPAKVERKKIPCPVKLTHSQMVHSLEMDVYTTVVNISNTDITAIAFGASHTDKFGNAWEPYKTDLSSERTIKRGHSRTMHWEILMEEPTSFHAKPGSSEMYVSKVAFADGRVFDLSDIEGCSFTF